MPSPGAAHRHAPSSPLREGLELLPALIDRGDVGFCRGVGRGEGGEFGVVGGLVSGVVEFGLDGLGLGFGGEDFLLDGFEFGALGEGEFARFGLGLAGVFGGARGGGEGGLLGARGVFAGGSFFEVIRIISGRAEDAVVLEGDDLVADAVEEIAVVRDA